MPAIVNFVAIGSDTPGIINADRPGGRYDLDTGTVTVCETAEFDLILKIITIPDIKKYRLPLGEISEKRDDIQKLNGFPPVRLK